MASRFNRQSPRPRTIVGEMRYVWRKPRRRRTVIDSEAPSPPTAIGRTCHLNRVWGGTPAGACPTRIDSNEKKIIKKNEVNYRTTPVLKGNVFVLLGAKTVFSQFRKII